MRKRRKKWMPVLLGVLIVLVGIAAASAALLDNGVFEVVLNGNAEIVLEYGQSYEDEGAYSYFHGVGDEPVVVDSRIEGSGRFDPDVLGTYSLTYRSRYFWNVKTAVRQIRVVDTQKPTIVLVHNSDCYTVPGQPYEEEGYRAEDNYDGDITNRVVRKVEADRVIYTVSDSAGNTTEVVRTIRYRDVTSPELSLLGESNVTLLVGQAYSEPGFRAQDDIDGDLTAAVQISGEVNVYRAGTYTLRYSVSDNFGNVSEKVRTVTVQPRNPEDSKVIYLTFDDGPGPYTERLLEILEQYDAKVTFFVVNTGHMDLLPKITAAGHAIGIHSYSHVYTSIYAGESAFFTDLHRIENIIYERTGIMTPLMRFPGGSSNKVSSFNPGIMTRLTKAVVAQGYRYFDWNVDSNDAGGAKTADEVFRNVVAGIGNKQYAFVLQHDIKDFSVEAVDQIVRWGLENGYIFSALTPDSPGCHHPVNN